MNLFELDFILVFDFGFFFEFIELVDNDSSVCKIGLEMRVASLRVIEADLEDNNRNK